MTPESRRIKKNKTCTKLVRASRSLGRPPDGDAHRTPGAAAVDRSFRTPTLRVRRTFGSAGSSSSARPSTVMTWRIRMARCAQLRPPPVRLSLADSAPAAHAATIVLVHRPTRESRPCDRSHANDVDQYVEVDPELHHPTSTLPLPPSIEHAFPVLAMTLAPHAGCSFKLPRIPHKHSSNHLTTVAHEDRTDTDPMPYARAMPFTPNRRAGVPSARHGGQPFCLATLTSRAAQSGSGTHPHPHPPEPMGAAATLLKVTRRRCSRSFQIRAHRTPHRGWCTA